jgi:cell division protein FtsZ
MKIAHFGVKNLSQHVDSIIVIPNNKLLEITDSEMRFEEAFGLVDEVLLNATRGITDIIMEHSFVNVDFADVEAVMRNSGKAMMGIGVATGENRAVEAAINALNSPFLDDVSIEGAKGLLVKVSADDLKMAEIDAAMSKIREVAGFEIELDVESDSFGDMDYDDFEDIDDENVIFGASDNLDLGDKLQVTLIATGLCNKKKEERPTGIIAQAQQNGHAQHSEPVEEPAVVAPTVNQEAVAEEKEIHREPSFEDNGNDDVVIAPSNPFKRAVNMQNFSVPRGQDALSSYDAPASQRRNGGIRRGMLSNN